MIFYFFSVLTFPLTLFSSHPLTLSSLFLLLCTYLLLPFPAIFLSLSLSVPNLLWLFLFSFFQHFHIFSHQGFYPFFIKFCFFSHNLLSMTKLTIFYAKDSYLETHLHRTFFFSFRLDCQKKKLFINKMLYLNRIFF